MSIKEFTTGQLGVTIRPYRSSGTPTFILSISEPFEATASELSDFAAFVAAFAEAAAEPKAEPKAKPKRATSRKAAPDA